MKNKLFLASVLALFVIYAGCRKVETGTGQQAYSAEPVLPATTYDYSEVNPSSGLAGNEMITLGRVLFYDKKMSLNNSVSCGSCHQQSKAFCDGQQFSTGLQGLKTRRNSPAIIKHDGDLFWDGRAGNFHDLAIMPLVNHVEMMNYDIGKLENKVSSISYYPELFNKAFGSSEVTVEKIQGAIASFLDCFSFDHNKFNVNRGAFTGQEQLGYTVFFNKAKCASCHTGRTFAGWSGGAECIGLDESYQDNGIGELSHNPADNARFRIPTLLNIEFTAPYMHDGRFKTLEEVVDHYNSGIKSHPNLSWNLRDLAQFDNASQLDLLLQFDINHDGMISAEEVSGTTAARLNLTDTEKKALVAFLKTLSDPSVYTDVRYSDPFVTN
jgi:cytochrome c peroxidase